MRGASVCFLVCFLHAFDSDVDGVLVWAFVHRHGHVQVPVVFEEDKVLDGDGFDVLHGDQVRRLGGFLQVEAQD